MLQPKQLVSLVNQISFYSYCSGDYSIDQNTIGWSQTGPCIHVHTPIIFVVLCR